MTYDSHFALKRGPESSVLLADHTLGQDRKLNSISAVHVDDVAQLRLNFDNGSLADRRRASHPGIVSHHYMLEQEIANCFCNLLVWD